MCHHHVTQISFCQFRFGKNKGRCKFRNLLVLCVDAKMAMVGYLHVGVQHKVTGSVTESEVIAGQLALL